MLVLPQFTSLREALIIANMNAYSYVIIDSKGYAEALTHGLEYVKSPYGYIVTQKGMERDVKESA